MCCYIIVNTYLFVDFWVSHMLQFFENFHFIELTAAIFNYSIETSIRLNRIQHSKKGFICAENLG